MGSGAGTPLRRTSSRYFLLLVASLYLASLLNFFRVNGSYQTCRWWEGL